VSEFCSYTRTGTKRVYILRIDIEAWSLSFNPYLIWQKIVLNRPVRLVSYRFMPTIVFLVQKTLTENFRNLLLSYQTLLNGRQSNTKTSRPETWTQDGQENFMQSARCPYCSFTRFGRFLYSRVLGGAMDTSARSGSAISLRQRGRPCRHYLCRS
jgi:hypothetical protein